MDVILYVFITFLQVWNLCHSCNVYTFNNSTVTLVGAKGVKTITGCFEPIDELIKVTYIQAVNEVIPALRPDAIHGLPNLIDVVFENDSILEIEAGAFYELPRLYLLKIKYNNIKEIKGGVFNGLVLKELCLTDNNIEVIHPNAFDNMPNLNILLLNENKLTTWHGDWFRNTPEVSTLNFESNLITTVPFRGFQNIKGVHTVLSNTVQTTVQLNSNKIRKIEDGAFDGIESLGWLFLHRNEIEEISEESLGSLKSIEWVRLDSNKLKCVPEKLVKISPKIVYYLYSNQLSEDCKNKYNITGIK